jgi:hypothetical protein
MIDHRRHLIYPLAVEVTVQCRGGCEQDKTLTVPLGQYEEWVSERGGTVQSIFKDLGADERELLISGTCGECWDKLFPKEDEGEG